ncbi:hypothetical protein CEQ90_19850 [Lewinellaceae bacterium SD302]|nr:hypothetical protein CEQ90_19850 [Lewinellaceae bacterium SD302]
MKELFTFLFTLATVTCCHAQFDQDQLLEFSNEIKGIEAKFDERERKLNEDVTLLNKQLATLKKEKTSIENLVKRIETLEGKQEKIEQISNEEKRKEIELVKVRYEAGLLVIKDMIEFLKTIKSQFSGLDFQQSYLSLANPNTYPSYKTNVDYLKEKLVKKGLTLPDIGLGNTMLNTVYSITRSIVSGKDDKHNKTKELVCILDFTSEASADLRIVNYDLEYLTSELDKMIFSFEELFKSYTKIIGYKKSFDKYISDQYDNLDSELIPEFFKQLSSKEDSDVENELKDLKFSLKKIIDSYQEYELFIRQGLAYYEKFGSIIANLTPNCSETSISIEMNTQFELIETKLNKAKSDFENAYKGKIKQTYIKQLIEG